MKEFINCLLMAFSFTIVTILIGIISKDFTFNTVPFSDILYSTFIFFIGCITATSINHSIRKIKSNRKDD